MGTQSRIVIEGIVDPTEQIEPLEINDILDIGMTLVVNNHELFQPLGPKGLVVSPIKYIEWQIYFCDLKKDDTNKQKWIELKLHFLPKVVRERSA